jgi:hypothetical protein
MKKVFAAFALLLLLIAGGANAQVTPYFQVFFPNPDDPGDSYYWQETTVCQVGMVHELYVVGKNMNAWIIGAEYQVVYPPSILYLGDTYAGDLWIGSTNIGVSSVWSIPQNGFVPMHLATVQYLCNACPPDTPISVIPNSSTGFLGYTDLNVVLFPAIGMVSTFCPQTIPTDDTTWGQVKALFE